MHKIITILALATSTMQLCCAENQINISHLDKPKLLQALFYHAKPQGNGRAVYNPHHKLSTEEAKVILERNRGRVDYLLGRSLKVDLSGNILDVKRFNRDNGVGMAQAV
jgi:hypothetical protein